MRKALAFLAMFVAVASAAPALAAPSPVLDLAAWVSKNTDLPVSQIAIAGRENLYSLEPLGPRVSTGEVLALVRTEALSPEWRTNHALQSWDAHILFDCSGGRVRVLRSASYSEPRRQGPARSNDIGETWFSPKADTPAATLLAAACDPTFAWPLRESATPAGGTPKTGPSVIQASAASPGAPVAQASPPTDTRIRAHENPAAEKPRAIPVLTAVRTEPPPVEPRAAESVPPRTVQRPSATAGPWASGSLQEVSYISGPAVRQPAVAQEMVAAPPHAGVFATTAAAMRTSLRWAGAGRGWLVHRVEFAFRRSSPPSRAGSETVRQARAD